MRAGLHIAMLQRHFEATPSLDRGRSEVKRTDVACPRLHSRAWKGRAKQTPALGSCAQPSAANNKMAETLRMPGLQTPQVLSYLQDRAFIVTSRSTLSSGRMRLCSTSRCRAVEVKRLTLLDPAAPDSPEFQHRHSQPSSTKFGQNHHPIGTVAHEG